MRYQQISSDPLFEVIQIKGHTKRLFQVCHIRPKRELFHMLIIAEKSKNKGKRVDWLVRISFEIRLSNKEKSNTQERKFKD